LKKKKKKKNGGVFSCRLGGTSAPELLKLDDLGFYACPLNSTSRGGARFVFSSATLATALTKALRKSGLPCVKSKKFVGVNPVFRMNHFEKAAKKG
jgi:hypothetical protein